MNKISTQYYQEIRPALQKKLGYKNVMMVPKVVKVVINIGTGRYAKEQKMMERIERDLALLSGQKPVPTLAKKSIAGFKIRQGMAVGLKVTLRGKRMYDFIERLVKIALPRLRDFRGLSAKNLDGRGTLNVGLSEQSIFPEIEYETQKDIFGLEVSVVTTAKRDQEALELFKLLGFPFKK